jgi:hypothetical protein
MILSRRSALAILSLRDPVTRAEIESAWKRAVRAAHPDAGGAGDIAELSRARDKLLSDDDVYANALANCGKNTSCKMCGGQGTVRGKFGATPCTSCN